MSRLTDRIAAMFPSFRKPTRRNVVRKNRRRSSIEVLERRALLAAEVTIVPVPLYQANPTYPHQVHEGAQITLKAVLRDATPDRSYAVAWDVNRNNNYDDDFTFTYTTDNSTLSIRDIGRTFLVPNVSSSQDFDINVRARDLVTGEDVFGTFQLFVHDFRPSNNPTNWTTSQREIINQLSVSESLWLGHRSMTSLTGSGSAITGVLSANTNGDGSTARLLELMGRTGHLPAYKPGSINTFSEPLPTGFQAANDARFNNDPYAESATRLLNYLVANASLVSGVSAADEATTMGYDAGGNQVTVPRIAGTSDGHGLDLRIGGNRIPRAYDWSKQSSSVEALATVLPALAGTRLQVGVAGIVGQSVEWAVQQGVDYIAAGQADSSGEPFEVRAGNWPASQWPVSTQGNKFESIQISVFAENALRTAQEFGTPYGIVVGNLHKYRHFDGVIAYQQVNGGFNDFSSSTTGETHHTSAVLGYFRWIGAHTFSAASSTTAFPGVSTATQGQIRQAYDKALNFLAANWNDANKRDAIGWLDGYFQSADYLQGNTNTLYNAGAGGHLYSLYLGSRGYSAGTPTLNFVGSHDWEQEFGVFLNRAQSRSLNTGNPLLNYATFGTFTQTFYSAHPELSAYHDGIGQGVYAGLTLLGKNQSPGNVAVMSLPATALAGQQVTIDGSGSFATVPGSNIVSYQWDFNSSNGLWWETQASPDAIGEDASQNFPSPGTYTVTLRTTDNAGISDIATETVSIVANQSPSDIQLNNMSVAENSAISFAIGDFTTSDGDGASNHTYSLVSGIGDTDNGSFTIDGTTLKTGVIFDFETKHSYALRVRSTDQGGLFIENTFSVTVADVDEIPPTVTDTSFVATGTVPEGTTTLTVTFSEPVVGADVASNYELRVAGSDGLLLSSDAAINPDNVTLSGNTATLSFGTGLAEDVYRLIVSDSITDEAGNSLDGDADSSDGGSRRTDFVASSGTETLSTSSSVPFDFETAGFGAGQLTQGLDNAFDGVGRLYVGDTPFTGTPATHPTVEATQVVTATDQIISNTGTFVGVDGLVSTFSIDQSKQVRLTAAMSVENQVFSGYSRISARFVVDGVPLPERIIIDETWYRHEVRRVTLDHLLTLSPGSHSVAVEIRNHYGAEIKLTAAPAGSQELYVTEHNVVNGQPAVVATQATSNLEVSINPSPFFTAVPGLTQDVSVTQPTPSRLSASLFLLNSTGVTFSHVNARFVVDGVPLSERNIIYENWTSPASRRVSLEELVMLSPGSHSISVEVRVYQGGKVTFVSAVTAAQHLIVTRFLPVDGSDTVSVTKASVAVGQNFSDVGAFVPVPGLSTDFQTSDLNPVRFTASMHLKNAYGSRFSYINARFVVDGIPQRVQNLVYDGWSSGETRRILIEDLLTLAPGHHNVVVELEVRNGDTVRLHSNPADAQDLFVVEYRQIEENLIQNDGQTLLSGSSTLSGLTVHREFTVPNTGNEDFARTVDVFTNPTGSSIATTVRIVGNLGSDTATTVFATSNGDTVVEPSDQWIGTDDGDGTGTPAIIHYIHGPAGLQPTAVEVIEDNIYWTYDITVPAGETLRLANYTILHDTRAGAIAAANALVTPGGFAGQAAAFLDAGELASLANFAFTTAVNLSVTSSTAAENNLTVVTVTATVDSAVSGDQTVDLDVTGMGITSSDYALSNVTITIPDGQTTGSVTFTVLDDLLNEGDETATLTISNPSAGLALGATTSLNVTITDDDNAGASNFRLPSSGAYRIVLNGGTVELRDAEDDVVATRALGTEALNVHGTTGADSLTIDLSGGDVIPADGIDFHGGDPSVNPGDALNITGDAQGTVTYHYTSASDGSVAMSNYGTVTYTGLEQISNTGTATDVIFNLPAGPNAVTLNDDANNGNGLTRLFGATIAQTIFASPSSSVAINRGSASDEVAVLSSPDLKASLTIGAVATPFDHLSFQGFFRLASGNSLAAYSNTTEVTSTARLYVQGEGSIELVTANLEIAETDSVLDSDGVVAIAPQSGGRVEFGVADGVNVLGLTNEEIARITAATLEIGSADTGNITVLAPFSFAGHLSLNSGVGRISDVLFSAAKEVITAPSLSLSASHGIRVEADVDTLTNAQTSNGGIGVELFDADNGGVEVQSVSAPNGSISIIKETSGNIVLTNATASAGITVEARGPDSTIFHNNGTLLNTGNTIELIADKMRLDGATIDSGIFTTILRPYDSQRAIELGVTLQTGANALEIDQGSLQSIVGSRIKIGGATTGGAITLVGALNLPGKSLSLETNSGVSDGTIGRGGHQIIAENLSIEVTGDIDLNFNVDYVSTRGNNQFLEEADSTFFNLDAGSGTITLDSGNFNLFPFTGGTGGGEGGDEGGDEPSPISDVIEDQSSVIINSPAVLLLNDNIETIGSLAGDGTVDLGNGALIVAKAGASTTFEGTLTGVDGSLGLFEGVILTLAGDQAYTGLTYILNGKLIVDGTMPLGSGVFLESEDSTLSGKGRILQSVNIQGGTLAPGNDVGILETESVTFGANSRLQVEIGGDRPGEGAGNHDQLNSSGEVTIGSNVSLELSSFDGGAGDDFMPTPGQSFTIIRRNGGSGSFAGLPEGSTITNFLGSGLDATISYQGGDGDDVVITVITTLDVTAPTSTISSLAANATSLLIPVSVNGNDPAGPLGNQVSRIMEYDLFVAVDSGSFTKFATVPASEPTTTYQASSNHTYFFKSLARDNAGNVEVKNVADAFTRTRDFDKPITQVITATPSTDGLFSFAVSGTEVGGSQLVAFDLYVIIDNEPAQWISSIAGGTPNGSGVYSGTSQYQAPRDDVEHSYRFYTVGRDTSGNVEETPASGDVVVANRTFMAPATLQATGTDVQKGANQRSFIRYVDINFNTASGVDALETDNSVLVERYMGGSWIEVSKSLRANGTRLEIDFGEDGLVNDGYYRVSGNDFSFDFHRLLGDADGDAVVTQLDTAIVDSFYGQLGSGLDGDLDGDGVVGRRDKAVTQRSYRGRTVEAPPTP
jgi:hypothetical protein